MGPGELIINSNSRENMMVEASEKDTENESLEHQKENSVEEKSHRLLEEHVRRYISPLAAGPEPSTIRMSKEEWVKGLQEYDSISNYRFFCLEPPYMTKEELEREFCVTDYGPWGMDLDVIKNSYGAWKPKGRELIEDNVAILEPTGEEEKEDDYAEYAIEVLSIEPLKNADCGDVDEYDDRPMKKKSKQFGFDSGKLKRNHPLLSEVDCDQEVDKRQCVSS